MPKKHYIKKRIEKFTDENSFFFRDWSNWYVGITNHVEKRKGQHQRKHGRKLKLFRSWTANSLTDAVNLEKYFLAKGMKGATGGWSNNSKTIYVYKVSGPGSR